MKPLRWRVLAFLLVAAGWLACGYLLYRLFALQGDTAGGIDVCSALLGAGCDETLRDPGSFQLGFPLAGWGFVYFAAVGLILGFGARWADGLALLLVSAGVGSSLVLGWSLLTGPNPLCPLCILVHLCNLGLLATLWLKPGEAAQPGRGRISAVLPLLALLVGATVQGVLLLPGFHAISVDSEAILAAYDTAPVHQIPNHPEDARMGSAEAPVQLVIFSSFQCPGCKGFAPMAAHLASHFKDQITIAFKHFPLSSQCNPVLSADLQPRSCEASRAAEAARLQLAFWPYHDGLFASDLSATEPLLEELATEIGLDVDRWQIDRHSAATDLRVAEDIQTAYNLGVDATPAVYLNGRRVAQPSLPALELLIQRELEAATIL